MRPWLAAAGIVVLSACGGPADDAPVVHYGGEECGFCRMIISEPRFTAALVDDEGETTTFDDVGCLINYLHRNPDGGGRVLVHDYAGDGWLAARDAAFVRDPRGLTPMGSGILAFSSAEAAAAQAAANGWEAEVLGWAPLVAESAPAHDPG